MELFLSLSPCTIVLLLAIQTLEAIHHPILNREELECLFIDLNRSGFSWDMFGYYNWQDQEFYDDCMLNYYAKLSQDLRDDKNLITTCSYDTKPKAQEGAEPKNPVYFFSNLLQYYDEVFDVDLVRCVCSMRNRYNNRLAAFSSFSLVKKSAQTKYFHLSYCSMPTEVVNFSSIEDYFEFDDADFEAMKFVLDIGVADTTVTQITEMIRNLDAELRRNTPSSN